jgi:hypothetical protein
MPYLAIFLVLIGLATLYVLCGLFVYISYLSNLPQGKTVGYYIFAVIFGLAINIFWPIFYRMYLRGKAQHGHE